MMISVHYWMVEKLGDIKDRKSWQWKNRDKDFDSERKTRDRMGR